MEYNGELKELIKILESLDCLLFIIRKYKDDSVRDVSLLEEAYVCIAKYLNKYCWEWL